MAKGYNAADAHRKALKAKDKKKNKLERGKARELKDVKKGTGELEREVRELSQKERTSGLSSSEQADLDVAKAELARLRKAKEEYIAKNPDAKDAILNKGKERAKDGDDEDDEDDGDRYGSVKVAGVMIPMREKLEAERQGLRFGTKGKLLNPEKSAYYDAVFNPFGAPPPGLPWRARPPTVEELAAAALAAQQTESSSDDSEDDIQLPGQPAPVQSDDDDSGSDGSDDSIPMPEGPPPGQLSSGLAHTYPSHPSLPPSLPTDPYSHSVHSLPSNTIRSQYRPFPSAQPPLPIKRAPILAAHPSFLPPKPGQPSGQSQAISTLPAPAQSQTAATVPPLTEADIAKLRASATISAAPQVRDLKKEATAFVPQATLRKRKRPAVSKPPLVATSLNEDDIEEQLLRDRAKLMKLPPGFAPNLGSAQGVALPPGFGYGASTEDGHDSLDGEEAETLSDYATVRLPQDFVEAYEVQQAHEDNDAEDVGPSRPPAQSSYYLPGMEEDEEDNDDYQGPALPQASGAYSSNLPGFDDEEDEEDINERATHIDEAESRKVTVTEDDDEGE